MNEGHDYPPVRVEPTKEQLAKLDAARDRTRSIGFEGNALVYYFNDLTQKVRRDNSVRSSLKHYLMLKLLLRIRLWL